MRDLRESIEGIRDQPASFIPFIHLMLLIEAKKLNLKNKNITGINYYDTIQTLLTSP